MIAWLLLERKRPKMSQLSFFAKPPFFRGHLYRGSSMIRGEQMAHYLQAQYNPKKKVGVCIYVKPESMDGIEDGDYIDVVDGAHLVDWLKERPKIKAIACSQSSYQYLKDNLKNEVVYLPQHHCNYQRIPRKRKGVKVVGLIGHQSGFPLSIEEVTQQLRSIGVDFITKFDYRHRQEVVDFYQKIDLQIIWPTGDRLYKNPLKIINAASFGIPTVAPRKLAYQEMEGFYIPVKTVDELVKEIEKFKNLKYYDQWSKKIRAEAEKYHISQIAKLYRKL